MGNLYRITKVGLTNSIGLDRLFTGEDKDSNKGLITTIGIGMGILLVTIMPFIYASAMADILIEQGLLDLLLVGAIVLSSAASFITSIVKAQGVLFSAKDYEMLMALPIKQSVILTSKMIQLLILNYFFTALIVIPTAIVYFNRVDIAPVFYVYLVVAFIFLPLVPIIVASIIAFMLSYVSSKVKFKNLFLTLGSFIMVLLIMMLSANINKVMEVVAINSESIVASISKIYPPALYFTNSLVNLSVSNLLMFILISVVPYIVFVFIFSKFYKSINSKLGESFKATNYKLTALNRESPIKSLIRKEVKGYLSSPVYILNTSVGILLTTIGSVASLFLGEDMLSQLMNVQGGKEVLPLLMMGALTLAVSISCTTHVSISLEGKKLWILKSSPIDEMDIFKGKIAVNLLILIPVILVNSFVLLISLKMNLIDFMWMIVIPSLYAIIISISGILINLNFPKLDWISETTVVKQSVSAIVEPLFGLVLVGIPIGILIFGKITNKNLYLIILSVVLIGLIFLLKRLLETTGVKMFREL